MEGAFLDGVKFAAEFFETQGHRELTGNCGRGSSQKPECPALHASRPIPAIPVVTEQVELLKNGGLALD